MIAQLFSKRLDDSNELVKDRSNNTMETADQPPKTLWFLWIQEVLRLKQTAVTLGIVITFFASLFLAAGPQPTQAEPAEEPCCLPVTEPESLSKSLTGDPNSSLTAHDVPTPEEIAAAESDPSYFPLTDPPYIYVPMDPSWIYIPVIPTTKKCQNCDVPRNADCNFYREVIVKGRLKGKEKEHEKILRTWEVKNCDSYASNRKGTKSFSIEHERTVNHQVSAGASVSTEVKTAAGAGPLAKAEATAGLEASIEASESGSESITITDTVTWDYDVPACEKHKAKLIVYWKDGTYSQRAYTKALYYLKGSNGPIQRTTCYQADANSKGISRYYDLKLVFNTKNCCGSGY